MRYALIGAGAALGGVLRYAVSSSLAIPFPWQTLVVNATGGLLIGYLSNRLGGEARFLWITGFCGGYTTFSTYSMEVVTLIEQGRVGMAIVYAGTSAVVCVGAAAATYHWTR
ncbi:MAG: CrcB family protein [Bryobacter sp.]|jgi:CrcB protein|nr:CrcB family protein [Bryobacter sp. CoA8 C33]